MADVIAIVDNIGKPLDCFKSWQMLVPRVLFVADVIAIVADRITT